MTHPHDDTAPVEHDPTGMRDLLAALPDPGPMPDDLVARITRALAEEARAADPSQGPGRDAVAPVPPASHPGRGEGTDGVGRVVPLRPRRTRLRHLGVAAAVVGAIGLGGIALGGLPGEVTASLEAGGGSDSAADSGESGTASSAQGSGADEGTSTDARSLLAPPAGSGRVVVVMSGSDHSSSSLESSARALDESGLEPLAPLAAESPTIGPIATPVGARTCTDALGIPSTAGILVDVADVDGRPAAVLVVHDDDGRTAYAVERSCTTGAPGLLAGPLPLS